MVIKIEKTNETINTTQENHNKSRYNSSDPVIREYFKEEELLQLTDKEFEILRTKIKNPSMHGGTGFLYYFSEGLEAKGLKGGETELNIFRRRMAAHSNYFDCFDRYSHIFTFCHVLGVTNLYDIGCGQQLQAFLLIPAPEMNYTGIDRDIFHDYPDNFVADPAYINELFEQFTGSDRIKYIKEAYPFDLATAENNIAISLFCLGAAVDEEKIKISATALSRDFDRIFLNFPSREYNLTGMHIKDIVYNEVEVWTNPFEKYYSLWKNAMPDFEFYKIGKNYIFGTKISEDREKLEKRYTLIDNQVLTGAIDIPWYMFLRL